MFLFRGHLSTWTSPLAMGEPDDMCQRFHWGFVIKGKMIVHYKDREEAIYAKEAYYLAPGHIPFVTKGTELLEMTPKAVIRKKNKAVATTDVEPERVRKKRGAKKSGQA